jgi:PadR family transcriptional regulator PadR
MYEMPRQPNPDFMAGVPELMILRLLQDREMYGYEIVQAVRAETGDVSASAKASPIPCCMPWSAKGR